MPDLMLDSPATPREVCSVTLQPSLIQQGRKQAKAKGFKSFSRYMEALLRTDLHNQKAA